jgi:hypothetical protein
VRGSTESLLRQLLRDVLNLGEGATLPGQIRISTLDETVRWIAHFRLGSFETPGEADTLKAIRYARAGLRPVASDRPRPR